MLRMLGRTRSGSHFVSTQWLVRLVGVVPWGSALRVVDCPRHARRMQAYSSGQS